MIPCANGLRFMYLRLLTVQYHGRLFQFRFIACFAEECVRQLFILLPRASRDETNELTTEMACKRLATEQRRAAYDVVIIILGVRKCSQILTALASIPM
jgi:hypothetical protein